MKPDKSKGVDLVFQKIHLFSIDQQVSRLAELAFLEQFCAFNNTICLFNQDLLEHTIY